MNDKNSNEWHRKKNVTNSQDFSPRSWDSDCLQKFSLYDEFLLKDEFWGNQVLAIHRNRMKKHVILNIFLVKDI